MILLCQLIATRCKIGDIGKCGHCRSDMNETSSFLLTKAVIICQRAMWRKTTIPDTSLCFAMCEPSCRRRQPKRTIFPGLVHANLKSYFCRCRCIEVKCDNRGFYYRSGPLNQRQSASLKLWACLLEQPIVMFSRIHPAGDSLLLVSSLNK